MKGDLVMGKAFAIYTIFAIIGFLAGIIAALYFYRSRNK